MNDPDLPQSPGRAPTELDLRGLKCPLPALRTGRALARLPAGALLRVETTDPMSVIDIPHLIASRGDRLVLQERGEASCVFLIERAGNGTS